MTRPEDFEASWRILGLGRDASAVPAEETFDFYARRARELSSQLVAPTEAERREAWQRRKELDAALEVLSARAVREAWLKRPR